MNSDATYDKIMQIKKAAGSLTKKEILRHFTEQDLKVLVRIYDPYQRYFMTAPDMVGVGTEQFNVGTAAMLNALSNRGLSGDNAKDIAAMHMVTLTPKSADLLRLILNKDAKMGLGVKSINQVFPGLIPSHDVMLAKPIEMHRVQYPCFMSKKVDGVRAIYKHGKFRSRNGHEYFGLDHIKEWFERKMPGTVFDGELYIPEMEFHKSSGLIRSSMDTPQAVYAIFDTPEIVAPFYERVRIMNYYELTRGLNIIPHYRVDQEDKIMNFYTKCRSEGLEGIMVKDYNHYYKGTRSYDWMKVKNVDTIDAKVTGISHGKVGTKYEFAMGYVTVNIDGIDVNVGGGWSDHERHKYYKDPHLLAGKTIEIAYHEKTPDGSLREPRFIRMREDKDE
jgi:DNA ligase-1